MYSGTPPSTGLTVTSATHGVAETAAVVAVLEGVRQGLSADGALAPGDGYPTLSIEVVRVDEVGRGLTASPPSPGSSMPSTARGAAIAVVARGWVLEGPTSPPSRQTGDVRRAVTYAYQQDARRDAVLRQDAVRAAGLETGRALARWVLGEPIPVVEPL